MQTIKLMKGLIMLIYYNVEWLHYGLELYNY